MQEELDDASSIAAEMLLKMASGYLQQNPWLTIATKQLELMHRYMVELEADTSGSKSGSGVKPLRTKQVRGAARPNAVRRGNSRTLFCVNPRY
jgi:hypothetical protein